MSRERIAIHLKSVEELGKVVGIAGFRDARVGDVPAFIGAAKARLPGIESQFFDADRVADWEHLFFAALNALKAFRAGRGLAQRLDMEVLVYASCQHQIAKAFGIVGLRPDSVRVAVVLIGDNEAEVRRGVELVAGVVGVPDDSVLLVDQAKFERLREVFGITDLELSAVMDPWDRFTAAKMLVVERCALVAFAK